MKNTDREDDREAVLNSQARQPGRSPDRRRSERFQDSQHVAIVSSRRRLICDLLDISESGAKLKIVRGELPAEGESLALTLFDGTSVPSIVGWIRNEHLGLKFLKQLTTVEAHLILEELGGNFYKKAVQLQKRVSQK